MNTTLTYPAQSDISQAELHVELSQHLVDCTQDTLAGLRAKYATIDKQTRSPRGRQYLRDEIAMNIRTECQQLSWRKSQAVKARKKLREVQGFQLTSA